MKKDSWSAFTGPEDICYCRCGEVYKSHAQYRVSKQNMVTRKKCPACGKTDNCRTVTSDTEIAITQYENNTRL